MFNGLRNLRELYQTSIHSIISSQIKSHDVPSHSATTTWMLSQKECLTLTPSSTNSIPSHLIVILSINNLPPCLPLNGPVFKQHHIHPKWTVHQAQENTIPLHPSMMMFDFMFWEWGRTWASTHWHTLTLETQHQQMCLLFNPISFPFTFDLTWCRSMRSNYLMRFMQSSKVVGNKDISMEMFVPIIPIPSYPFTFHLCFVVSCRKRSGCSASLVINSCIHHR